MSSVGEKIRQAREHLARLVHEVCGACRQNCCHQGTMMGSQGLRRLYKGLLLDPDLGQRLRRGLRERRKEIVEDLQIASKVTELLEAANLSAEERSRLPELHERIADLRRFVEYLGEDFPLTPEGMRMLLLYTAIRANLLRCLRQFPGAEAALVTLSQGRGSFRFRGRKMAPPRCIFHQDGCLAEDWKPIKCANFFCASEPNLVARARAEMSFDEFVLANIRPLRIERAERLLRLENELGPDYWEPKIFIGPEENPERFQEHCLQLLRAARRLQLHSRQARFMRSTREILSEIENAAPAENLVFLCESIDGAALYELAVAFEQARSSDWGGGFFLFAAQLTEQSFLPHPLWQDQLFSQPLGGLEIYYVE